MKTEFQKVLKDLVMAYEREVNPSCDWKDTALTKEEFEDATKEYRRAKEWLIKNSNETTRSMSGNKNTSEINNDLGDYFVLTNHGKYGVIISHQSKTLEEATKWMCSSGFISPQMVVQVVRSKQYN